MIRSAAASVIFTKTSGRYWAAHRWQAALMLVGMALGVAVVFAVDLANESSKRAFSLSLDAVTGRTTHHLVGGSAGLEENVYTTLRTGLGFRSSAPVVEGSITLVGKQTETLQVIGVDLFAEPMFRDQLSIDEASSGKGRRTARQSLELLATGAIILGDTTAARLGVDIGDTITPEGASSSSELKLISTIDTARQAAFDSLAMVDISTAQQLLSMQGRLTRIDLVIDRDEQLELLKSKFPELRIVDATRRNNALTQMTQAFHTNLLAMSLLALLVGAFLIYNTVTLSVLQRRSLFGQLRVSGVLRRELFGSILFETLVFALVGTLCGLLLGYLLGSVLLTLVTRTINDLYFTLDVRRVELSIFSLIKATAIGIGVALLAALAPALEAANSQPVTVIQRSSLERRASAVLPLIFIGGIVFITIGIVVLWLSQRSLWAGFSALFCIVIGYSLLIPSVLVSLTRLGGRAAGLLRRMGGAMGQYPLRSMTASLSRTSVAIAALVVAVSATAGVGIMISSFRLSVSDWLQNTLQSDIYIRDAGSISTALPADLKNKLEVLDGVSGLRWARLVDVETDVNPAQLFAVDATVGLNEVYNFNHTNNKPRKTGEIKEVLSDDQRRQQFLNADSVYLSEPFARKNNFQVGDVVTIAADKGVRPFDVAGIFTDYGAGKGLIVIAMDTYHRYWNDRDISSIGVTVSGGSDVTAIKNSIRQVMSAYDNKLMMRSNVEIRDMSLTIFDRTFAITHVLRLLTIGVAFVGILSALMALSLERRSEFAVLRALGITPRQLRNLLFLQTGLMGILAGVLAIPLGIIMSKILVSVINVRSFGWTMEFLVPVNVLLESVVLAVVASLLAGWYPAVKLSQMSPAEALRHQ